MGPRDPEMIVQRRRIGGAEGGRGGHGGVIGRFCETPMIEGDLPIALRQIVGKAPRGAGAEGAPAAGAYGPLAVAMQLVVHVLAV